MFARMQQWRQAREEQWLKAWEDRRRMGLLGFVLVWGFGRLGLLVGLIFSLVMGLMKWLWDQPSLDELVRVWVFCMSVWIPAGVWLGVWLWFDTEKKYKRQVRRSGREPTPPGIGDPDAG